MKAVTGPVGGAAQQTGRGGDGTTDRPVRPIAVNPVVFPPEDGENETRTQHKRRGGSGRTNRLKRTYPFRRVEWYQPTRRWYPSKEDALTHVERAVNASMFQDLLLGTPYDVARDRAINVARVIGGDKPLGDASSSWGLRAPELTGGA